jgi:predicted AAA+ superfamily ATPase
VFDRPAILAVLRRSPVVAFLGPRQCGKTTLARRLLPAEDPVRLARWRDMIRTYVEADAPQLDVRVPTARRYLELLTGLLLVRQLPPWRENLGKRHWTCCCSSETVAWGWRCGAPTGRR